MHDIDRTLTELETEDEHEVELEGEGEFEFDEDDDASDEFEADEMDTMVGGRILDDAEETEAASDLMSVSSDEELEQFLGSLFKKVRRKVGGFLKRGVGRRLLGTVRGLIKRALPIVGGALGSVVPGLGTALGGSFGGLLSGLLEVELEGMSPEDQEFEAARRCVRIAADAAANATKASQTAASPQQIVRAAVLKAARKHAPGLTNETEAERRRRSPRGRGRGRANTGRWVRRGKFVIVIGA